MKKLIAAVRFLFRERLFISEDPMSTSIADVQFDITPEDIVDYNDSINNGYATDFSNTIHPVYFSKINWHIIEHLNDYLSEKIDEKLIKTIVHTAEKFSFHQKITTNCVINVKSQVWSLSAHKKGTKIAVKFSYYCDDILVGEGFSTGLMFGVKYVGSVQNQNDNFRQSNTIIKNNCSPIWQKSLQIDKQLPYTYAQKAQIDAPIHTDPKFAKSIGLPDIILQGTCTFAKSVSLILSEEAEGGNSDVESTSVRFTGMMVPPGNINVRLLKKEQQSFYFDVLNDSNESIIKGGEIHLLRTKESVN